MLGGRFRASFRPLNDAIIQGRIRGVVGIVGCNNPKDKSGRLHQHADPGADQAQRPGAQDRLRGHRLGQGGHAHARSGAGGGRRRACARSARPSASRRCCTWAAAWTTPASWRRRPRSCSRAAWATTCRRCPAVGVAPEWMSEKAVAIGCYFVASGIDVVLGHPVPHRRLGERHPLPQRGDEGAVRRLVPRLRRPAPGGGR